MLAHFVTSGLTFPCQRRTLSISISISRGKCCSNMICQKHFKMCSQLKKYMFKEKLSQKQWLKHCQRQNRPKLLTLYLYLYQQLKWKQAVEINYDRVNSLGPFCLWHVSFANLATRWQYLHKVPILPWGGTVCISYKSCHQVKPLALSQCPGLHYCQ